MKKKTIKEMREKDQFFTKEHISKKYIKITKDYLKIIKASIGAPLFIEPSAGNGDFFFNFKWNNKLAYDIDKPSHLSNIDNYIEKDFLSVDEIRKDTIYIGNPPFGKRGTLAYDFILKCIELDAEMIGFILPPNVNTIARVKEINKKGYSIVYSDEMKSNSFYLDDNTRKIDMDADAVFQIYMKDSLIDKYKIKRVTDINLKNNDFVKVYSINTNIIMNKNRNIGDVLFIQDGVGKEWVDKCDFYLPLRVFESKGKPLHYKRFNRHNTHNIGFGIICKDKDIKNKIIVENCYRLGTNKVYMAKKQFILKEIMRVKNLKEGDE